MIVRNPLVSTYRLQFNKAFTFRDAAALVPYLAELGISHIYASPYLKARAGSTHGYDIIDYNALNPEIGDEADLAALCDALQRHKMGQVLDFVPNHMGVGKADSDWWLDVLEWGQASPYADYFDIDWTPAKEDLRGKVLLPFLGDHYGRVLENGELEVKFDAERGGFFVSYHEHAFPIRPSRYGEIIGPVLARLRERGDQTEAAEILARIAAESAELQISRLPAARRRAVRDQGAAFKRDLAMRAASPAVRSIIDEGLANINGKPGVPKSFEALHRLLQRQAYRLAYWRVAADEINYRRFFDVNELAGMRMENVALFEDAHRLVLRLVREGKLDGLRIDHVDGMRDPAGYCRQISDRLADIAGGEADASTTAETAERRFYIVVEKILARHESLRRDWPIDGTTGYDVLNLINGLFVRPEAEAPLTEFYQRFTGQTRDFDQVLHESKLHVIDNVLSSELQVLANRLDKISESHWGTRDFTLPGLRAALRQVAAAFPVYRTYVDERSITADDRRDIDWAIGQARKSSGDREDTVFEFLQAILTGDAARQRPAVYSRRAVTTFAMKFQQYTGPVMAKSLEDTSFYRFTRLLSLNEVGGDPRRFGLSLSAFHHLMQDRARLWPRAMTATATHDTKRGEDSRVRLDVLTEMTQEWDTRVSRWSTFNRRFKSDLDGEAAPSANDEYLLYQILLGSWPVEWIGAQPDGDVLDAFGARVEISLIKSVREAKIYTSWTRPDAAYEDAAVGFARGILDPARSPQFLADFADFAGRVAWFGMLNGLSQMVLKLTLPGVPDIYQGGELWDTAMVDPDNRRPVDFGRRVTLLDSLRDFSGAPEEIAALLSSWPDGRLKLLILSHLLRLRRRHPDLFLAGGYEPLTVSGPRADHLCAFARVSGKTTVIVVAPRFFVALTEGRMEEPARAVWRDVAVSAPPHLAAGGVINLFTGRSLACERVDGALILRVADLLDPLPVGVWLSTGGAAAPD